MDLPHGTVLATIHIHIPRRTAGMGALKQRHCNYETAWDAPQGSTAPGLAATISARRSQQQEVEAMAAYIPSPRDWVREQVELYESSGGTKGTTLRDTGLPVIIVTHVGNKTGAIRKTPLMRVK